MFVEVNNHHLLTLQQVIHHMLLLYSCTTFMVHTLKQCAHQKVRNSEHNIKVYQDGAETFQLHIALQNHSLAATG